MNKNDVCDSNYAAAYSVPTLSSRPTTLTRPTASWSSPKARICLTQHHWSYGARLCTTFPTSLAGSYRCTSIPRIRTRLTTIRLMLVQKIQAAVRHPGRTLTSAPACIGTMSWAWPCESTMCSTSLQRHISMTASRTTLPSFLLRRATGLTQTTVDRAQSGCHSEKISRTWN